MRGTAEGQARQAARPALTSVGAERSVVVTMAAERRRSARMSSSLSRIVPYLEGTVSLEFR